MVEEKLGRYGENPHQTAWKDAEENYEGPNVLTEPLHGKPLGYNNLLDAAAALEIMLDLKDVPAGAVLKHTNPCGLAIGADLGEAFENAWKGDEVSAFGSIIGYTGELTEEVVRKTAGKFVEVLIAPKVREDALDWLKSKKAKEGV